MRSRLIPQTWLVDRRGAVVFEHHGELDEAAVRDLAARTGALALAGSGP